MSLSQLEQVLQEASSSPTTREKRQQIYNFIEQALLSPETSLITHVVPTLDTVIKTLNDLLRVTKNVFSRTPEILDLLSTIEFHRNHVTNQIKAALVWQKYYKGDKPSYVLATPDEKILQDVETSEPDMRRMYFKLLQLFIETDLYWLWTGKDAQVSEFVLRLNEYFPKLNPHFNEKSKNSKQAYPRLFHKGLTPKELEELYGVGEGCCQFTRTTVRWAERYSSETNKEYTYIQVFQTIEFRKAFPPPIPHKNLVEALLVFADKVSKAASSTESVIGTKEWSVFFSMNKTAMN